MILYQKFFTCRIYIPDAFQHLSLVVSVAITEFHQVNVDSFKEVHVPLLYSAQKLMSVQHCTLNVTATVTQTEAAGAQLLSCTAAVHPSAAGEFNKLEMC